MTRTADAPLIAARYSAATHVEVYSAQAVRLCKLEKVVYHDAPTVVACQSVKQLSAVVCRRPGLAQMNNVNAMGKQTVDEQGFAGEKRGGSYYKPEHFLG